MGDPKRIRKKYDTPSHPWIKSRIDEEKILSREFGTKNKKELWKMETVLKKFKAQAKKLIALKTEQAVVEREHLFRRVGELGLVKSDITYDSILSLSANDILSRRLQSVLVTKELARSVKQARQFITHEHILVAGKVITSPAYLVSVKEESDLGFHPSSPFFKEDHPERTLPKTDAEKKADAETQPKKVSEKKAPLAKKDAKKETKKEELVAKKESSKEIPKVKAEEVKAEEVKAEEVKAAPVVKDVKEEEK